MKVRELVNILEELPQDKEVMVGYLDIEEKRIPYSESVCMVTESDSGVTLFNNKDFYKQLKIGDLNNTHEVISSRKKLLKEK